VPGEILYDRLGNRIALYPLRPCQLLLLPTIPFVEGESSKRRAKQNPIVIDADESCQSRKSKIRVPTGCAPMALST
jgi:hypothetical protein